MTREEEKMPIRAKKRMNHPLALQRRRRKAYKFGLQSREGEKREKCRRGRKRRVSLGACVVPQKMLEVSLDPSELLLSALQPLASAASWAALALTAALALAWLWKEQELEMEHRSCDQ